MTAWPRNHVLACVVLLLLMVPFVAARDDSIADEEIGFDQDKFPAILIKGLALVEDLQRHIVRVVNSLELPVALFWSVENRDECLKLHQFDNTTNIPYIECEDNPSDTEIYYQNKVKFGQVVAIDVLLQGDPNLSTLRYFVAEAYHVRNHPPQCPAAPNVATTNSSSLRFETESCRRAHTYWYTQRHVNHPECNNNGTWVIDDVYWHHDTCGGASSQNHWDFEDDP